MNTSQGIAWKQRLISHLVPPVCWNCRQHISSNSEPQPLFPFLCRSCFKALPWMDRDHSCLRCGNLTAGTQRLGCPSCLNLSWSLDQTWSVFEYAEIIRDWILQLKFGKKEHLAPMLGRLIASNLNVSWLEQYDAIVPIPLHKTRLRERGFNQSLLLTHYIVNNLSDSHIHYHPQGLKRVLNTKPQAELPEPQRRANVEKAFQASQEVQNRNILLVDDVMTTGETLNAAARTLKKQGAGIVGAVVFARRLFEST